MKLLKTLLISVAAANAVSLNAQETPHDRMRRENCRLAEQVLRTGHPAPQLRRASQVAQRCREIGDAVAEAMNRHRTSTDTALLNAITSPMQTLRDGRVYQTALEIARDKNASVPARVFAIRALVWTLQPGGAINYADVADEWPDGRDRSCVRNGTPLHLRLTRGEPIPSDYGAVINRFGVQTAADTSEPRAVRRAAFCAQYPAMDVSRR